MTTAFVLSGGGSLGAVQVGMLAALGARGVRPDVLVGTSAGAVNALWVSGHGMSPASLDRLAALWISLRRADVFPTAPSRALLALAGRVPALCRDAGLRRLLDEHRAFGRLEDAAIPVHVVATDLLCGEEVLLSAGDAVSAVLASCAIPGILPPVEHGSRVLVDGGVAHHAAVSQAVALGATEVYVLPAGYPCALPRAPRSALAVAVQALTLLIEQRLVGEVTRYAGQVDVHVLPPLCPLSVSAVDFRRAGELISRSRAATAAWLDEGMADGPGQERFLSLHRHPGTPHRGPARP